ncbi:hypothetical protein CLAIMM_09267 isoform 2 [Cladophialophora immunda]|nr:hypothetical protein CLAIMM_09267 isoform 2 [Cladophialophora immunda]
MAAVIEVLEPEIKKELFVDEIETANRGDGEFDEREIRKIVHKVDRRYVTIAGLMVAISLLDRTNLSNANIAGMSKDLDLAIGTRYSVVVLIFFAPYVIAEIPLAALVRKIGPRWALPSFTLAWGIVMIGFAFVHHWTVLIGLRIILGILEAAVFPGLIYVLSLWYTRYEIHKRYAYFYFIGLVGSSLGGVLAFGFMQMGGLQGLGPWRWIFLMEGILTVVVALISYVFFVDYPQNAHKEWRFLSEREAAIIISRINKDRQDADAHEKFTISRFLRPALDLRIWGYGFIYTFSTMVAYAVAYFLPLILNHEIGFDVGVSQLLSTPPYIFAGIEMWIEGWLADRLQARGVFIIFNSIQGIVGLSLLAFTHVPGVQYFGLFLITGACNANIPCAMAWQANNIRGHWTRVFCSAVLIMMGGTGGIIGALVFRSQDAPGYRPGIYACYAASGFLIVITTTMIAYFRNCWKYGMLCKRRPSPRATMRQRHAAKQATRSPSSVEISRRESQVLGPASGYDYGGHASQQTHSTISGLLHSQYLGEISSVLQDTPSLPPNHLQTTAFSKRVNQEILRVSEATAQVPEIVLHAYADAYFQYAFHRFPVLDHADIFGEQPPIVLCQAVCMVGSNLRRSRQSASLAESEKYYFKTKTLVQMDFEQDPITTLKALCLLSTWSTATRLLQQIGLNREAGCASQSQPKISRRLAWYLYVQDKFVSAALGRPTAIKSNEFDVKTLTKGDFEVPNIPAMLFMEAAKLACILGRITDLRFRWPEDGEVEVCGSLL